MPRYDYRCRACGSTFELNRPMAEANAVAQCPEGHDDTVKLLSTVAVTGAAKPTSSRSARPTGQSGGGCCGGACCST